MQIIAQYAFRTFLQPTSYTASTVDQAKLALDHFARKWDASYPTVSKIWETHWDNITPFFQYPADIRKVI